MAAPAPDPHHRRARLMAQVLKAEVRARIEQAALGLFAEHGYGPASMAAIAAEAGTAPANVYRYFGGKAELFDAVVPAELAARHDALLDRRVTALAGARPDADDLASELLEFWIAHRLEVVVLLDRADGTPFAGYPGAFVERLAGHVEGRLGRRPTEDERLLLTIVFDHTRRAIAHILATTDDPDRIRTLVHGFWRYQLPGLDGLLSDLGVPPTTSR